MVASAPPWVGVEVASPLSPVQGVGGSHVCVPCGTQPAGGVLKCGPLSGPEREATSASPVGLRGLESSDGVAGVVDEALGGVGGGVGHLHRSVQHSRQRLLAAIPTLSQVLAPLGVAWLRRSDGEASSERGIVGGTWWIGAAVGASRVWGRRGLGAPTVASPPSPPPPPSPHSASPPGTPAASAKKGWLSRTREKVGQSTGLEPGAYEAGAQPTEPNRRGGGCVEAEVVSVDVDDAGLLSGVEEVHLALHLLHGFDRGRLLRRLHRIRRQLLLQLKHQPS